MSRLTRRTFLKTGVGAGISLALARPLRALQAEARRVKGVIWLWMDGGMSQFHTFDPKPELKGLRNAAGLKAIDTTVPEIRVSELMPVCASQMHHLSIIRSMSQVMDHSIAAQAMHTGVEPRRQPDAPSIGTILARELGTKDFPLPKYLALGPAPMPVSSAFGEEYVPFRLKSVENPISDLHGNVGATRQQERVALLLEQNKEWSASRLQEATARLDVAAVQTGGLMYTPLLKAFNVREEPEPLRTEYGPGFGQECLMARRLVQAGCPFVEIGLGGWTRRPSWLIPYKTLVPVLDRGLGTLVKDLAEKKMLRDTLVVCATEYGKPPFEDREHWCTGFSVALAGGSLAGGRVVGGTGIDGTACVSPVPLQDFFATIYLACGIEPETEYQVEGRKYRYVKDARPVIDLFLA